uniref:Retrotransposon gag domain-containing protein n=1 Tax=Ananas comosus var. bracteatus TaxID=296719 RepID=A0A6V7NPV5_ANACO|nr:unnamed protein product [Ananas comosus var. bracteatus]
MILDDPPAGVVFGLGVEPRCRRCTCGSAIPALGGRRLDRTYESVIVIGRPSGKVVVIVDRTHWELLFSSSHTLWWFTFQGFVYCRLIEDAQIWWQKAKKSRGLDTSSITWEEFREIVFMEYFPDSDRRKMKEDFRKLRQGNRSVREYEREFTHLVNYVPGMVHTDRDRADYFERGLRPEIFKIISALKLKSFEEVLDRALWVERSNAIAREERESFDREREREKGKKRTTGGAGGQSSSTRPPRYPRPQQRQPGHISRDCLRGASSAQPTASVQSPARQRAGPHPLCQLDILLCRVSTSHPDLHRVVVSLQLRLRILPWSTMSWQVLFYFMVLDRVYY